MNHKVKAGLSANHAHTGLVVALVGFFGLAMLVEPIALRSLTLFLFLVGGIFISAQLSLLIIELRTLCMVRRPGCTNCRYPYDEEAKNRCPECGKRWDQSSRRTMMRFRLRWLDSRIFSLALPTVIACGASDIALLAPTVGLVRGGWTDLLVAAAVVVITLMAGFFVWLRNVYHLAREILDHQGVDLDAVLGNDDE